MTDTNIDTSSHFKTLLITFLRFSSLSSSSLSYMLSLASAVELYNYSYQNHGNEGITKADGYVTNTRRLYLSEWLLGYFFDEVYKRYKLLVYRAVRARVSCQVYILFLSLL